VTKQTPNDDAKKRPAPDAAGAAAAGEPLCDKHGGQTPVESQGQQGEASQPAQSAQVGASAEEQLAKLREELDEMKDRALRAAAELENYRKRAQRELQDALRYANMPLLRDLLPVLDNVHRALDSAESTAVASPLVEGIKMVAQQLEGVLARHHCEPIDALGSPFDPNLHEAIMQQPSTEHPPNTVLAVIQRGYRLHERVVRPSQVIVAVAPAESSCPATQQTGAGGDKRGSNPPGG
jgi:molecular chaperone GrpE